MPRKTIILISLFICQIAISNNNDERKNTHIYQFNIESQVLTSAINRLSEVTNLEIMFFSDIAEGITSSPVIGEYTATQALDIMLSDSQLERVELENTNAMGVRPIVEENLNQQVTAVLVSQVENQKNEWNSDIKINNEEEKEEKEENVNLDTLIVTGSHIPKLNTISSVPVQTLDSLEIEQSGSVDLGEILEQLPGVSLGLSPEGTLLSTQNAGISSVSLRNLGSNRTLTLIDGHRTVSNSGNAQRIDLGTIPIGFIDRVEITTGGASAVYGSDAIAGVVNILLKDNFQGVSTKARYATSQDGGEDETTLELTMGTNFAEDRGNVMLSLTYDDETAVKATDRDFALLPTRFRDGEFNPVGGLSSNLPGGRFEGDDAWNVGGVWFNDQSLAPLDGRDPSDGFEIDLDGYNFRNLQMVSPQRERFLAGVRTHYNFTDNTKGSLTLLYSSLETLVGRAAANARNSTDFGAFDDEMDIGTMSASHPFIPAEVEETRSGSVSWIRRFNEVGNQTTQSERDTLRLSTGLDGYFSNTWEWDAKISYGKFEQDQTRINGLNYQNIQYALDIEENSANPGTYQCSDADARNAGCVPLNVFGEGSITEAMADYIRSNAKFSNKLKHQSFNINFTGELAELSSGPLSMATGFEYRKEQQTSRGDLQTKLGNTSHAAIPDLDGSYHVNEAFVELYAPLLADRPGFKEFFLEAAIRAADYSTIGRTSSWKLGLNWAFNPSIRFRAQVSSAERAPDITELFSSLRGDFDNANDPCDGVTAASTGAIANNCLTDTGIQTAIAEDGIYEQISGSVFAPNGGNLDLHEESALTFTAGFIFTPQNIKGLSIIIDYYDIDIDDAISTITTQTTLDLCYNSTNFPNNRFCDVINRDGIGQISRVINQEENLNKLISRGIDATIDYDFSLGNIPGKFDFETRYTYIDRLESHFTGIDGNQEVIQFNGGIGNSTHQARTIFGWKRNAWRIRYRMNYIGSANDDINLEKDDIDYLEVGSFIRHDLYAHYKFGNDNKFKLFFGINNLNDNKGPFLPTGTNSGSSRNFSSAYDPIGRFFYAGIKLDL